MLREFYEVNGLPPGNFKHFLTEHLSVPVDKNLHYATNQHASPFNPLELVNHYIVTGSLLESFVVFDPVCQKKRDSREDPLLFKIGGCKLDLGELMLSVIREGKQIELSTEPEIFFDSWLLWKMILDDPEGLPLLEEKIKEKFLDHFKKHGLFKESERIDAAKEIAEWFVNTLLKNHRKILRELEGFNQVFPVANPEQVMKTYEELIPKVSDFLGSRSEDITAESINGCEVLNGKHLLLYLLLSGVSHIGSEYLLRNRLKAWGYEGKFSDALIFRGKLEIYFNPQEQEITKKIKEICDYWKEYFQYTEEKGGGKLSIDLEKLSEHSSGKFLNSFEDDLKEFKNAIEYALKVYEYLLDKSSDAENRSALMYSGFLPLSFESSEDNGNPIIPYEFASVLYASLREEGAKELSVFCPFKLDSQEKLQPIESNYLVNFLALILGPYLEPSEIGRKLSESRPGEHVTVYLDPQVMAQLHKLGLIENQSEELRLPIRMNLETVRYFLNTPPFFLELREYIRSISKNQ